jgi:hypothetical protein
MQQDGIWAKFVTKSRVFMLHRSKIFNALKEHDDSPFAGALSVVLVDDGEAT